MPTPLFDIPLVRIDGTPASLADYAGRVLLIVNVASKCGLTPQYEGLEALYARYGERGLAVLGFPANDFGRQEPGSEAEIAEFCRSIYGVEFPMFSKITVTGPNKHELYRALIAAHPEIEFPPGVPKGRQRRDDPNGVTWNFEKFLVGRDGSVLRRFAPDTEPESPVVVEAIEAALAN